MQTYGGYKWVLGEERTTTGEGELCGAGWLHAYHDPLLAVLLDPIHANFGSTARLFAAEAGGRMAYDRGLKMGATSLTLTEELPLPTVTPDQRVKFAKLCADWAQEACLGPRLDADIIAVKLAQLAQAAVQ